MMKKMSFVFLLCPLICTAQAPGPRYRDDTLYATCGYKIYPGQTLKFGKGTGKDGKFMYVSAKNGAISSLADNSVVVKELKKYDISALDIPYIELTGTMIFKDGSKGHIDIHIEFEQAIQDSPGLPGELVVPAEFRNNARVKLKNELDGLFDQYRKGVIKREEYELQKKKLLDSQ